MKRSGDDVRDLKNADQSNSDSGSESDYSSEVEYDSDDEVHAGNIVEFIQSRPKLMYLELAEQDINAFKLEAIKDALKSNTAITEINLYRNPIGDDGSRCLSEILTSNTTLIKLNLKYSAVAIADLVPGVIANTTLKELNLSKCAIIPDEMQGIVSLIKSNKGLTKLNLSSNAIRGDGVRLISEALKHNTTLKYLNLYDTKVNAITPMVRVLEQNSACVIVNAKNRKLDSKYLCGLMNLSHVTHSLDGEVKDSYNILYLGSCVTNALTAIVSRLSGGSVNIDLSIFVFGFLGGTTVSQKLNKTVLPLELMAISFMDVKEVKEIILCCPELPTEVIALLLQYYCHKTNDSSLVIKI